MTKCARYGAGLLALSLVGVLPVAAQAPEREGSREVESVGDAGVMVREVLARELDRLRMDLPRIQTEMAATRIDARAARAQELRALRAQRAARGSDPGHGRSEIVGSELEPLDITAPPAWLQQDPGDSLYREAREALNDRDYRRAASMFAELIETHPESGYAPDAYYYRAFALYRAGRVDDLNESLELLHALVEKYPDASTVGEARRLIVRVEGQLARHGDVESTRRLVDQASGSCQGKDYEVRAMALSALINMDSDRAMPILTEVLHNRDDCPELRKRAVFLVSQHGGDEVVDLMLDLAYRDPDPDPEVRSQAVFWLSQVDSPEAVDALESILEGSEDREVQKQALFALSQHDSPRALAILQGFAERGDAPDELRGNAIFWLSQNSRLGLDYLTGLWDSIESQELRKQILFGVSQIGDREAADWLMGRVEDGDLDVELRKNALFWLSQSDMDVAGLLDLYDRLPEREMREQVLFALSQEDSPESVDALMDIARSDDDPDLREKAIFWLGQSDDPRVADFLLELIRR